MGGRNPLKRLPPFIRWLGIAAVLVGGSLLVLHRSPTTRRQPPPSTATITTVYDGDTLRLSDGSLVRLLGIDAPELDDPNPTLRKIAREATDFLESACAGKRCRIEFDPMEEQRDRYGRWLCYIYVKDKLINEQLLERGLAYVYARTRCSKKTRFVEIQKKAQTEEKGLWDTSVYERIDWKDADEHVGQDVLLEGRIVSTHRSKNACFLNFHPNYKRYVYLAILRRYMGRFPPYPERLFRGKRVRVFGRLKHYRGRTEILLTIPPQIQITSRSAS